MSNISTPTFYLSTIRLPHVPSQNAFSASPSRFLSLLSLPGRPSTKILPSSWVLPYERLHERLDLEGPSSKARPACPLFVAAGGEVEVEMGVLVLVQGGAKGIFMHFLWRGVKGPLLEGFRP